jgi:hypothetical protein
MVVMVQQPQFQEVLLLFLEEVEVVYPVELLELEEQAVLVFLHQE